MPDTCATCRFSRERTSNGRAFLACQRRAPDATGWISREYLAQWWPAIAADDWCGEFEAIPQPE